MSSILYASEIVYFTKTDLDKLDAIQSGVARQLCQVNSSTASVSSLIETGLIPISILIKVKKLKYYLMTKELADERLVKQAFIENNIGSWRSRFLGEIRDILTEHDEEDPDELLETWTSEFYTSELDRCCKSLCVFPRNYSIGVKSEFLNDSWLSGVLCSFRSGNAGLGNRAPTPRGSSQKLCVLCNELGIKTLVNEIHVALVCPFLESIRLDSGLRKTITELSKQFKTKNSVTLLRLFLGEDLAEKEELYSRAIMLHRLRTKWYNFM